MNLTCHTHIHLGPAATARNWAGYLNQKLTANKKLELKDRAAGRQMVKVTIKKGSQKKQVTLGLREVMGS